MRVTEPLDRWRGPSDVHAVYGDVEGQHSSHTRCRLNDEVITQKWEERKQRKHRFSFADLVVDGRRLGAWGTTRRIASARTALPHHKLDPDDGSNVERRREIFVCLVQPFAWPQWQAEKRESMHAMTTQGARKCICPRLQPRRCW